MDTTSRTLADELLLLALDDAKGAVHSAASLALDYGLAGAILMELAINNRLTTPMVMCGSALASDLVKGARHNEPIV
jgi:hypothetical protein